MGLHGDKMQRRGAIGKTEGERLQTGRLIINDSANSAGYKAKVRWESEPKVLARAGNSDMNKKNSSPGRCVWKFKFT
jgi:hypothetical protein